VIGHAEILEPFSGFLASYRLRVYTQGSVFVSVNTEEYYDGDELVPVSRAERFRNSKLFIGLSMIGFSVTGLTLAASFTINSGKVEFGQGIYKIQSCDQWVGINLVPSDATYDGLSRVANIQISGLDATRCRGSNFKIQLYPTGAAPAAMALFSESTTPVDRLLLSISSDITKVRANAVSFIDGSGRLVTANLAADGSGYAYDRWQYLTYATTNGVYSVTFTRPLATVSAVNSLTVQSASQ
jgi:hypothetical protein